MKKGFLLAWVFAVCAVSAHAQDCEEMNQVIAYDDNGMGFTDLIMVQGKPVLGCIARTPKLAVDSLKNAKLKCEARKGRLPYVSEVNNLASYISLNFLLEKKRTDRAVLEARFMNEERAFWTATVEKDKDEYHHKRAVARLTHLAASLDMSKAKVEWVGTHLDNKEERPFICVFEKAN